MAPSWGPSTPSRRSQMYLCCPSRLRRIINRSSKLALTSSTHRFWRTYRKRQKPGTNKSTSKWSLVSRRLSLKSKNLWISKERPSCLTTQSTLFILSLTQERWTRTIKFITKASRSRLKQILQALEKPIMTSTFKRLLPTLPHFKVKLSNQSNLKRRLRLFPCPKYKGKGSTQYPRINK